MDALVCTHYDTYCFFFHSLVGRFCCQEDDEELTFKKGDIMTMLRKDQDGWYYARHSDGREGLIPNNFVEEVSITVSAAQGC